MASDTREILIGLIERFEGFYPKPYLCSAGVPTIGFGTTFYPDKRRVKLTDPAITKEQAYKYAWSELNGCIRSALRYSPCLADDARALAAIASFIYNLGSGSYLGSTLRKKINAGDREAARAEIMKWCKAGGKTLRGLVKRRAAESMLL